MESIVHDMRCPNCGSHALEPDKDSYSIFVCTMCGSKLNVEYKNHKDKGLSALLIRGFTELECKKIYDASFTFEEIVTDDPSCSKGYWGRFLSDTEAYNRSSAKNYDIVERFQIKMRSIPEYDAKYNSLDDIRRALISGEITLEMLKKQSIPEIPIPELEDINLRLAYKFATSEERKYYDSVLTRTLELAFERTSKREVEERKQREEHERQEEERIRREKERWKRREKEHEEFFRNVDRYEKTENIEELQCLEEYFNSVSTKEDHCCASLADSHVRMCREKIKKVRNEKIGCLSMIIVPPIILLIILLLGYLIFG